MIKTFEYYITMAYRVENHRMYTVAMHVRGFESLTEKKIKELYIIIYHDHYYDDLVL